MSYYGTREQAKSDAKAADHQIDGLEPGSTSPVRSGSDDPGGAPMEGSKEFTTNRTRGGPAAGQGGGLRRAYPETKATNK